MLSKLVKARGPSRAGSVVWKSQARFLATGTPDNGVSTTSMTSDYDPIERMNWPSMVSAGSGLRSSRTGRNVAVFGATGFLGGFIVSELGRGGNNIVVATRGDDMSWRHLKTCCDYGKLVPSYISLNDEESVRNTIRNADVVINAMGKHYETKHIANIINCSFEDVNVKGAELVARIAREENCKHLVHISAAQANKESNSRIGRSKAEGEERVLEQFPGAVIVRPNLFYGDDDRYLIAMATIAEFLPIFPLVNGGQAVQYPVYVGDVGLAVTAIAENFTTAGKVFNLSGENDYSTREMIEFVMDRSHHTRPLVEIPLGFAELVAKAVNNLPNPYINPEQLRLLLEDTPGPREGEHTFTDLGIKPANFESKAFNFLHRFRRGGHFVEREDGTGHFQK